MVSALFQKFKIDYRALGNPLSMKEQKKRIKWKSKGIIGYCTAKYA